MLYDTHCHPNLAKNKKPEKIINNFLEENKKGFLNIIGTDLEKSKQVLELSKKFNRTFCSIGIHPCDIFDLDLEESILELEKLYLKNKEKIVAIGECGLDYYWLKAENDKKIAIYNIEYQEKIIKLRKKIQKIFFKAQINLAKKYNLPVIIHNRESSEDVLEILKETGFKNFIFHCYSENLEYAQKLLEFAPNCKISFSGIVTFKNAKKIQETAGNIPLKNILVETDSPYLTPTPFRGKQENEPVFSKYVLEKIIELRTSPHKKQETREKIEKQIFKNSLEIFNINQK